MTNYGAAAGRYPLIIELEIFLRRVSYILSKNFPQSNLLKIYGQYKRHDLKSASHLHT